jgi:hypothetical protein
MLGQYIERWYAPTIMLTSTEEADRISLKNNLRISGRIQYCSICEGEEEARMAESILGE